MKILLVDIWQPLVVFAVGSAVFVGRDGGISEGGCGKTCLSTELFAASHKVRAHD